MIGAGRIPVIDVGPLTDPAESIQSKMRCASNIGSACETYGFFYIINHGIAEESRRRMFDVARRFFDLPESTKLQLRLADNSQFRGYVPVCGEVTAEKRDWHECLDIQPLSRRARGVCTADEAGQHILDDPGQWPPGVAGFAEAVMRAWDERIALADTLVEGLAMSLGVDPGFFHPFMGVELCDLRLSHYPPAVADAVVDVDAGMGAHVDLGFLAILDQDDVGGLEVETSDGLWVDAPHVPGAYLVNVGLMMQRWTNGRYRAAKHRVRLPRDRSRYSIPFFYEPRADAVVAPLDVCCDEDDPPRYPPCRFGDFLGAAFTRAYREAVR